MEELINRAKKHDQMAWNELFELTSKEAYYIALKIVGEQNAQDLLQDAYITAYEKIDALTHFASFQTWLNVIVTNKCRDFIKKRKPLLFTDMGNDDYACDEWEEEYLEFLPECRYDKKETSELVTQILNELPEDQKICVILYYYQEMSIIQISDSLQLSDGTVKSRLSYARKKIKEKVLALEKNGTSLYGLTAIPFFVVLLKGESSALTTLEPMEFPGQISKANINSINKKPLNKKVASVFTNLGVRIGAAVVAGSIVVVGGGVLIKNSAQGGTFSTKDRETSIQTSTEDLQREKNAAISAYKEYLKKGVTERYLPMNYYSMFDLEKDGIPELLVAEAMASKEQMSTSAELYAFQDGKIIYVNSIVSHYDHFYEVNSSVVRGSNRYGPIFVSKKEKTYVEIYHWNEEMTRNDPAIVYEDGTWDYITAEKFEYYRYLPSDEDYSQQNSYVKKSTAIQLLPNDFTTEIPIVIKTKHFNLLLPKAWEGKYIFEDDKYCMREKESYEIGYGGNLFSILMFDTREEFEPIAAYRELGEFILSDETTKYFVAIYPTDVQFTIENQEKYNVLWNDVDSVLNNIVWKIKRIS